MDEIIDSLMHLDAKKITQHKRELKILLGELHLMKNEAILEASKKKIYNDTPEIKEINEAIAEVEQIKFFIETAEKQNDPMRWLADMSDKTSTMSLSNTFKRNNKK